MAMSDQRRTSNLNVTGERPPVAKDKYVMCG